MQVTMQSKGRIQLSEELLRSKGWENERWFEIEQLPDGIALRPVEPPTAPETIRRIFSTVLSPLGSGRGEANNKYVDRWRHKSGAVVVCEREQPNVWLARKTFKKFKPGAVPGVVEYFSPGSDKIGFHSNVAATRGLKGIDVVKIRAGTFAEAEEIASTILEQLERHP